jgi:thiol:disulfide interchange protein DsbA
MKHAFAALALLGLCLSGCGREQSAATPEQATLAPAPASAPADAARAPTAAALEKAATANQETTTADDPADRGDARLERMAALPESAQLPSGKWRAGTNYLPLAPAQPTAVEPGQVEVLEVFWYGCPHCYHLDPALEAWKKTKPAYVKFVRVPVTWGPVHRAHARLFYTLEALGKLDALHTEVFDEIHKRNNFLVDRDDAQTQKLQIAFAKAHGISESDFTRAANSFGVNAALQHAEDITRRYRVEGVPVVYINGKFQTDVTLAGSNEALVSLITDLSAAEKRR